MRAKYPMHRSTISVLTALLLTAGAQAQTMPDTIRRFEADLSSIESFYPISRSERGSQRFTQFFTAEKTKLAQIDRFKLDVDGQMDYDLLANYITSRLDAIDLTQKRNAEMKALVPFQDEAAKLEEDREATHPAPPDQAAKTLQKILDEV